MNDNNCCCRKKHRTEDERRSLTTRLNKIEGQVRGIKGMIDDDVYCADILIQIEAARSALASLSRVLLESHIKSCVADDIRNGVEGAEEELVATLKHIMK